MKQSLLHYFDINYSEIGSTMRIIPSIATIFTRVPARIFCSHCADQVVSAMRILFNPIEKSSSSITLRPINCLYFWFRSLSWSSCLSLDHCRRHQSQVVIKLKLAKQSHCNCQLIGKTVMSAPTISADIPSQRKYPAVPSSSTAKRAKPNASQCQKEIPSNKLKKSINYSLSCCLNISAIPATEPISPVASNGSIMILPFSA